MVNPNLWYLFSCNICTPDKSGVGLEHNTWGVDPYLMPLSTIWVGEFLILDSYKKDIMMVCKNPIRIFAKD